MSEERQLAILELLHTHREVTAGVVERLLLDELVEQRNKIKELCAGLERHRQVVLRLAKEIDRMKGVHGA